MPSSLRAPLVFALVFLLTALPVLAQPAKAPRADVGNARLLLQYDGEILEQALDGLTAAPRAIQGLTADGIADPDALAIFEGHSFETTFAADGSLLAFERNGNRLERVFPSVADGYSALSVRWNEALDTLFIDLGSDRYVLQIEGVVDPLLRARHLARLAVLTLGADLQVALEVTEKALPAWAVVTIALAGIAAYILCITEGTEACDSLASSACGNGNYEKKVICGLGQDLAGNLQSGYYCSYICGDPGSGSGGGGGGGGGGGTGDDGLGDPDPISGG